MTNTIVITKKQNDTILVTRGSSFRKQLSPSLTVYETPKGVDIRDCDRSAESFDFDQVLEVVRKDGTVVPINDKATLFDELSTYFFFKPAAFGEPLVPSTNVVNDFASLPPFGDHLGEYWQVDNATGWRLLLTYKASGVYKAEVSGWRKINDAQALFADNQFLVQNSIDPTKGLRFSVSSIGTGAQQTASWRNQSGIVAFLSDLIYGSNKNYQENLTENSTNGGVPLLQVSASNIGLPNGRYEFKSYCELNNSTINGTAVARSTVKGTIVSESPIEPKDNDNYYPIMTFGEVDVLDGNMNVDLEFFNLGSGTASCRNAKVKYKRIA